MALSHFIHYQYTKNAAKIKLAQRLGFDTIEDVYDCFQEKSPELNDLKKAVDAYSDAYADLQNSFNFSLPKKYETASEAQIQNWGEARKLFDKLYPGGDLSDFNSEDFQEALFEQFFEPNPNSGEDGNPLKLQNNFHLFTSKRFSLQKIIAKGLARQFWHFVQTGGFKCRCRAV